MLTNRNVSQNSKTQVNKIVIRSTVLWGVRRKGFAKQSRGVENAFAVQK